MKGRDLAERKAKLRARGRCVRCSCPHTNKNPNTGKLQTRCAGCAELTAEAGRRRADRIRVAMGCRSRLASDPRVLAEATAIDLVLARAARERKWRRQQELRQEAA